jgi:Flp pilus assembly protein TadG
MRTPALHPNGSLQGERGASAVEFAIIAPVLFVIVMGIIGFGVGFMELQTARGAVREGARAAAVVDADRVGRTASQVQTITVQASAGLIPNGSQVSVTTCPNGGGQAIVRYDTSQANDGSGITVNIPFLPPISMNSVVTAEFMCEG